MPPAPPPPPFDKEVRPHACKKKKTHDTNLLLGQPWCDCHFISAGYSAVLSIKPLLRWTPQTFLLSYCRFQVSFYVVRSAVVLVEMQSFLLWWCINAAPLYAAVKITSTNCAAASWLLSLLLWPWILCLASLTQHPLPFLPTLTLLVPLDLCIHHRAHLLYIASARTACVNVFGCAHLPQAARHAISRMACLDVEERGFV